tara:strand:- start:110385 stop:110834 length:450 start_codon:yes stop_codon:yes gene_type:complete
MAFFSRRIANKSEAEDLTQEVFSRLAQANEVSIKSPEHYVFQIAANLLRDRSRRAQVRFAYSEQKRMEDFRELDEIDPFRITVGREHVSIIRTEIAKLPEKTRNIFVLYKFEDIDKAAIAGSFGLSVRMVEIHIRRALLILSERLGEKL